MIEYESTEKYLGTATSLKDRIAKIEAIISALYTTAERAAINGDVSAYTLDDGQVRIGTNFRTVDEVMKSIYAFEKLNQLYINRLTGRMIRLVDGKNMRGPRGGNF